MKLHTAARIASRYTTGASADAITRRIVKGIKTTLREYYKTRAEKDDRHLVEDGFTLSDAEIIILRETVDILKEIAVLEETSNPREAGFPEALLLPLPGGGGETLERSIKFPNVVKKK